MKRPLVSLATLVAAYSVTAGTAVALFIPRAHLNNLQFKTSTVQLQLSQQQTTEVPMSFVPSLNFAGATSLTPGQSFDIATLLWVMNNSTPGNNLRVSGKMLPGTGDWAVLRDLVEMQFEVVTTSTVTPGEWYSLAEWEAGQLLPNPDLTDGQGRRYRVRYRMVTNYPTDPDGAGPLLANSPIGNELMGKIITGATFEFSGEKVQ